MQKLKNFFNAIFGNRNKKKNFTIEEKKKIYGDIINGNLNNLIESFKLIDEKNLDSLTFSNYRWNPIHLSIWYNQSEILMYLLEQECGKTWIKNEDSNSELPLHLAVFRRNPDFFVSVYEKSISNNVNYAIAIETLSIIHDKQERKKFIDVLIGQSIQKGHPNSNLVSSLNDYLQKNYEFEKNNELNIKEEIFNEWSHEEKKEFQNIRESSGINQDVFDINLVK